MELKHLLNNNNWEESGLSYGDATIRSEFRKRAAPQLAILFRQHKKNLLSNLVLLLLTIGIWCLHPTVDFLLPAGIIALCILFILLSTLYQFIYLKKPDQNQDIKTVLEATLAYDKALYKWQCRFFSVVISGFTVGGFLMGLMIRGANINFIFTDLKTLLVMTGLTITMFSLSKTKTFRKINRSMNPRYFKTKKFIEEQLNEINNKNF